MRVRFAQGGVAVILVEIDPDELLFQGQNHRSRNRIGDAKPATQVLERVAERVSRRPGWTSAAVTRVAYSFADAIAARGGSSVMCLPERALGKSYKHRRGGAGRGENESARDQHAEPIHRLACMCQ